MTGDDEKKPHHSVRTDGFKEEKDSTWLQVLCGKWFSGSRQDTRSKGKRFFKNPADVWQRPRALGARTARGYWRPQVCGLLKQQYSRELMTKK
jgi:hypothetical protein